MGKMMHFRREVAIRLAMMFCGCLLGVAIAELALRALEPAEEGYCLWMPNLSVTFAPEPGIVHGVGPRATIKVNSHGILGDEWSENRTREYRILAVGGSTTQCIMLDQSKTWPSLLEGGLRATADGREVWVGNLGRAGANSRDHLGVMELAMGQHDVDAVLMLLGGNDVVYRLVQGDTFDPRFVDDEERYLDWVRDRFVLFPSPRGAPLYQRTAIWRLARRVRLAYANRRHIRMDNAGRWLSQARRYRRNARLTGELPPLEPGLDEYEHNVTLIVNEARRQSLRLILLTQPTLWADDLPPEYEKLLWMGHAPNESGREMSWPWWESGEERMYTAAALANTMSWYNRRLLQTCAKLKVECFDLAECIPRTGEMFFDDMHYTELGARRVADEVAAYMKTRRPFLTGSEADRQPPTPPPDQNQASLGAQDRKGDVWPR
jgi:lysophospholipase L1-like esterase